MVHPSTIVVLVLHVVHAQLIRGVVLHGHANVVLRDLLSLLIYLRIVFRVVLVLASWLGCHAEARAIAHFIYI